VAAGGGPSEFEFEFEDEENAHMVEALEAFSKQRSR
jgi:hypothetical protein